MTDHTELRTLGDVEFLNPAKVLMNLGPHQLDLAASNVDDRLRSLRMNKFKALREAWHGALLTYIWSMSWGKPLLYGSHENQDYDIIVRSDYDRALIKVQLKELPPKIEDIRRCAMSDYQIRFYRDVVENQGSDLVRTLKDTHKKVPYMHVFAVLNYLKQICNHPALLEGENKNYSKYASGKWDLSVELLEESLGSGQKVVVFSQYVKMLELIESYLRDHGIDFATINIELQTVFYRIVQHQLLNIHKHSAATHILINISVYGKKIKLSILDNGMGIDLKNIKFGRGFSTIQEKSGVFGGSFNLESIEGKEGFKMEVII